MCTDENVKPKYFTESEHDNGNLLMCKYRKNILYDLRVNANQTDFNVLK